MEWIFLFFAVILEIIATTLMKISDGFTKLLPTIGTFSGYIMCFYFFSLALKKIDIGVAYAIWGATGIIVIAIIGIVFFHETVSVLKVVSIFFIVIGVIGVNLSRMGY